jgi:ABC-type glycerol-3-phosphate transport system permease component
LADAFPWFLFYNKRESSLNWEEAMSENNGGRPKKDSVTVTLIIVVGIIILACIVAFTAVSVAFLLNAPWRVPF